MVGMLIKINFTFKKFNFCRSLYNKTQSFNPLLHNRNIFFENIIENRAFALGANAPFLNPLFRKKNRVY